MTAEEALRLILAETARNPEYAARWDESVSRQADRTMAQLVGSFMRASDTGVKVIGVVESAAGGTVVEVPDGISAAEAVAAFELAVFDMAESRLEAMGIEVARISRLEDL